MMVHAPQKFFCNGETGAFSDNGIDAAMGASGSAQCVTVIVRYDPVRDLRRMEDLLTIEAPANGIFLELLHVIV